MTIFAKLAEKPWLDAPGSMDERPFQSPYRLGLRFFLGVVTVIFFMLIVAYGGRMALDGAPPPPEIALLWPNTVALALSSVAIQWALISARRGRTDHARLALQASFALAVLFLGGQLLAWHQLAGTPFFEMAAPAIAFFYLITGLHGLHIVGGLVALGRVVVRDPAGVSRDDRILSTEVCATYFHFMLGVWVVLFALVFTGDNMDLLLTLCGVK
jgi:cytochrome c oxidase subunit III